MSKARRGFSVSCGSTTVAFIPGDGTLEIQATLETSESAVVRGRIELEDLDEIESFMRDMRRVVRDSGRVDEIEPTENPAALPLPGLDPPAPAPAPAGAPAQLESVVSGRRGRTP